MKKRYAVLLLSALLTAAVSAEDITTTDGTVYKNIKISETTPIGLNFVSDDKACWVDFRDLPPDTAKKYGYDPVKAADFEKMLAQNQANPAPANVPAAAPAATGTPAPAAAASPAAAGTALAQPVGASAPVVAVAVSVPPPPVIIVRGRPEHRPRSTENSRFVVWNWLTYCWRWLF